LKYFDRVSVSRAKVRSSNKEHGVAGFERVYETGHVYRAEPHATSRHLTEYYSLDFELGFIDGPEDIIQVERELLTFMFERLHENYGDFDSHLPLFTGQFPGNDEGIKEFIRRMQGRCFSGAIILEQWPQPRTLLNQARSRLYEMFGQDQA
jgi:hypothetical protein